MSDSGTYPNPRSGHPVRLAIVFLVLLVLAAAVYFGLARPRGPRHIKVGLITWTQDPFWKPLLRGAQDYADASNAELTVVQSEPTVDAETKHIRQLLDSGIDGVAISPNDAVAQKEILDETAGKMPLVTFDTDAPDTKRRRFVGIDNYAAGRLCADELRDAMPKGGPVLISVGSIAQSHGRARRQGLIDDLIERGFDRSRVADSVDAVLKGPTFSIAATVTDDGNPAKAVEMIAAALKAHPDIKGIAGLYSYSAPAALQALKQVGRRGVAVVGFDESEQTQAAIEAGTIHSSILQDSYRAGYSTIEVLANEIRGIPRGPAEQTLMLDVPIDVLTPGNIQDRRASGAIRPLNDSATSKPSMP